MCVCVFVFRGVGRASCVSLKKNDHDIINQRGDDVIPHSHPTDDDDDDDDECCN